MRSGEFEKWGGWSGGSVENRVLAESACGIARGCEKKSTNGSGSSLDRFAFDPLLSRCKLGNWNDGSTRAAFESGLVRLFWEMGRLDFNAADAKGAGDSEEAEEEFKRKAREGREAKREVGGVVILCEYIVCAWWF